MTVTAPTCCRSATAHRVGYVIAAVINAALLYLLNVRPGWQALPFLTADTRQALMVVNLSLLVGVIVNAVYLTYEAPWLTSLGELATTGIGLAVLVRIWQVFPFDFRDASLDWALPVRIVLVVAILGAAIGMLVQIVSLLRVIFHRTPVQPGR